MRNLRKGRRRNATKDDRETSRKNFSRQCSWKEKLLRYVSLQIPTNNIVRRRRGSNTTSTPLRSGNTMTVLDFSSFATTTTSDPQPKLSDTTTANLSEIDCGSL
eukprot:537160-Amphidinium_carterae.1